MGEEIFTPPHAVECLEGKLFLERFVTNEPVQQSENLQQLTLSASIPNDFRGLTIKGYYQECVKNLISAAPNLKLVKILGGVQYAPKNP
uniref:Recep_L_domain domain-containing protein n=2 Tax=Bursaphelenchus xylophilus TaxID=6326 RepID=A0A1I7SJP6_BURXY